jgi:hypothetical protein
MQSFDFRKVLQDHHSDFNGYLQSREKEAQREIQSTRPKSNRHVWFLVTTLVLCLGILSAFAVYQNNILQKSKNQGKVAGVSSETTTDQNKDVILSGAEFSLIIPEKYSHDFATDIREAEFPFVNIPTPGQLTTILTGPNDQEVSGIKVYVQAYDNKLDKIAYNNAVLTKLGPDYQVVETIQTPKNNSLTKYQRTDDRGSIYFSSVTAKNYYVVEVVTSAENDQVINDSSLKLAEYLYLN